MPSSIGSLSMGSLPSCGFGPFTDPAMPLGTRAQDAGPLRDPCTTRFLSWLFVSSLAHAPRPFRCPIRTEKAVPTCAIQSPTLPRPTDPIDRSTVSFRLGVGVGSEPGWPSVKVVDLPGTTAVSCPRRPSREHGKPLLLRARSKARSAEARRREEESGASGNGSEAEHVREGPS